MKNKDEMTLKKKSKKTVTISTWTNIDKNIKYR